MHEPVSAQAFGAGRPAGRLYEGVINRLARSAEADLPASVQTTMNVDGQPVSSLKREANSKVIEMALKPVVAWSDSTRPSARPMTPKHLL